MVTSTMKARDPAIEALRRRSQAANCCLGGMGEGRIDEGGRLLGHYYAHEPMRAFSSRLISNLKSIGNV